MQGTRCSKEVKSFALPQPRCAGQGCVVSRHYPLPRPSPGAGEVLRWGLRHPIESGLGKGACLMGGSACRHPGGLCFCCGRSPPSAPRDLANMSSALSLHCNGPNIISHTRRSPAPKWKTSSDCSYTKSARTESCSCLHHPVAAL